MDPQTTTFLYFLAAFVPLVASIDLLIWCVWIKRTKLPQH